MRKWQFISLWIISIILMIFQTNTALAETGVEPNPRPKIGLALGGGSAGGFAHIGVLKWLEEHHIPIDYLAGTSMGGLMGGCYATGMTPAEISALVYSIQWNDLFNPNPPYSALDFRRKEDLQRFPVLEIGYRNGSVRLPSGLGVFRIDLVLSRIASAYPSTLSFDQLPTPFKCVATDVQNFQSVVFEDGSLKEALRATMAIPGIFTPVEQDSQVLVDGGILNNVPVEIVKAMGSDVVIAVNIAAPVKYHEIESIDSVLGKTIDTVLANNSSQSLRSADIILTPSFEGMGLLQWDAAERYIEQGYQAASKAGITLLKYTLSTTEWQKYLAERQARRRTANLVPTAIQIRGASKINTSVIQKQLAPYIGQRFNPTILENDLTGMMGSGLYESLSYEFMLEHNQIVLLIIVKEKTYGPPFIRFGVHSETSGLSSDNYELNLGSRLTSFNITGPGSELRIDVELGTKAAFEIELYKPILNSSFFLAPALYVASNNHSLFRSDTRVSDYHAIENGLRFDLGYSPNKNSEFRLGYTAGYQTIKTKVGEDLPDSLGGSARWAEFKWAYRSADDFTLPGKSLTIDFTSNWHFSAPDANTEFGRTEAKLRWNIPITSNGSWLALLAAGTSTNELPLLQKFNLGGPFRLSAYSVDQFQGDNYLLGTIGYFKLIPRWSKRKKVYAGFWLENGAVFNSWSNLELTMDLSLGLITSTFLGPLTVGSSFGEDSNQTLFMVLGHVF